MGREFTPAQPNAQFQPGEDPESLAMMSTQRFKALLTNKTQGKCAVLRTRGKLAIQRNKARETCVTARLYAQDLQQWLAGKRRLTQANEDLQRELVSLRDDYEELQRELNGLRKDRDQIVQERNALVKEKLLIQLSEVRAPPASPPVIRVRPGPYSPTSPSPEP